jgi:hypothetical protein
VEWITSYWGQYVQITQQMYVSNHSHIYYETFYYSLCSIWLNGNGHLTWIRSFLKKSILCSTAHATLPLDLDQVSEEVVDQEWELGAWYAPIHRFPWNHIFLCFLPPTAPTTSLTRERVADSLAATILTAVVEVCLSSTEDDCV